MILGAVIGTVVCSMLNAEEQVGFQEFRDDTHHRPNYTNQKEVKKSRSTKLYFNLLLFFIIITILFCL